MRHLDLFSGIGGFALAAQTVWGDQYENIGFCDNDKFCQQVLKKHWPNAKIYDDIKTLTYARSIEPGRLSKGEGEEILETGRGCDLITGGFPCQPFSHAGRRKGTADDRHLWPEMLRVIREFKPLSVVAENVRGLLTWNEGMVFEQVCADLENEGYDVQAFIIPAVAVNAPHRRERVWFVADRSGNRWKGRGTAFSPQKGHATRSEQTGQLAGRSQGSYSNATDTDSTKCAGLRAIADRVQSRPTDANIAVGDAERGRQQGDNGWWSREESENRFTWDTPWVEVAAELCGVDDGFPAELDGFKLSKSAHRGARLKALGNAIVPQVAMQIFRQIALTV